MFLVAVRAPASFIAAGPWTSGLVLGSAVLLAALVAFVTARLGARRLGCGLGLVAGTIFLLGLTAPPHQTVDRLPWLLVIVLAAAGLLSVPRLHRFRLPFLVLLSLAAGGWLAGGLLAIALAALCFFGVSMVLAEADGGLLAVSAVAWFASLHAAGAAAPWALLAVVPAGACAAALVGAPAAPPVVNAAASRRSRAPAPRRTARRGAAPVAAVATASPLVPAALGLASVASAVVAGSGTAHRAIGPAAATVLALPAAWWLMRKLRKKLAWAALPGALAAGTTTVALVALCAFSAAALTGLR